MTTSTLDRHGGLVTGSRRGLELKVWRRRFPWGVAGHLGLGLFAGVCAPLVLASVLGAMVVGRLPWLAARGEALVGFALRWPARVEAVRFGELLGVVIEFHGRAGDQRSRLAQEDNVGR
jgi:hypothetical protein